MKRFGEPDPLSTSTRRGLWPGGSFVLQLSCEKIIRKYYAFGMKPLSNFNGALA